MEEELLTSFILSLLEFGVHCVSSTQTKVAEKQRHKHNYPTLLHEWTGFKEIFLFDPRFLQAEQSIHRFVDSSLLVTSL